MALADRIEILMTAIFPTSPGAHGSTFNRQQKRFAPCPDSPNCVSTQAPVADKEHAIAPIVYTGTLAEAHQRLLTVINTMPDTTVMIDEPDYLHVECRSRLMRFVDDVEFFLDDAAHQIHFRSAARLGRGDLGVNRKRMEEIRRRFAA